MQWQTAREGKCGVYYRPIKKDVRPDQPAAHRLSVRHEQLFGEGAASVVPQLAGQATHDRPPPATVSPTYLPSASGGAQRDGAVP